MHRYKGQHFDLMIIGILPILQIPFDSLTFVPLSLQNSRDIHSDVSLQRPVIFVNIDSYMFLKGFDYRNVLGIRHIEIITILAMFSKEIPKTFTYEISCVYQARSAICTWI